MGFLPGQRWSLGRAGDSLWLAPARSSYNPHQRQWWISGILISDGKCNPKLSIGIRRGMNSKQCVIGGCLKSNGDEVEIKGQGGRISRKSFPVPSAENSKSTKEIRPCGVKREQEFLYQSTQMQVLYRVCFFYRRYQALDSFAYAMNFPLNSSCLNSLLCQYEFFSLQILKVWPWKLISLTF